MFMTLSLLFFFFQAEDGIRDWSVTGVQTCALPILGPTISCARWQRRQAGVVERPEEERVRREAHARSRESTEAFRSPPLLPQYRHRLIATSKASPSHKFRYWPLPSLPGRSLSRAR